MEPLLNSAEIMDYLDIKRRKFQELAKSDPTFPVKKLGGEWRADPKELREWFNNLPGPVEKGNVVQINTKRKRGRPPKRIVTPAGGWEINIPE